MLLWDVTFRFATMTILLLTAALSLRDALAAVFMGSIEALWPRVFYTQYRHRHTLP